MEPSKPDYTNKCIRTPHGFGEYTLIRCGLCTLTTRHPYLGDEKLYFSCPCGHSHPPSKSNINDASSHCTTCIAVHICPTICCWNCESRKDLNPLRNPPRSYQSPKEAFKLSPRPMYPYTDANPEFCESCERIIDSACIVQWEMRWMRRVTPWEDGTLTCIEEWEEYYKDDEDFAIKWRTFEIGVMNDDEPTGDIGEFRREAVHRKKFPYPWDKWTYDITRFDTGFTGWGLGSVSEDWEKSCVKGEVIEMLNCDFNDYDLDESKKRPLELGI